jgi:hypothetical protein
MKKSLFMGVALLASGVANASTVFMPTNPDVNFFNLTLAGSSTLAMFDDNDTGYTNPLAVPLASLVLIGGPDISGDFTATNVNSQSITLTNNNWFTLAVSNGGGWLGDNFSSCNSLSNSCVVVFGDGSVLTVDTQVAAVPVPAALWLFGAGLLGLAGVARRKNVA